MKRYELKFKEGVKTVFKVSLVKGAAIETNLVHFSKEKEEVHTFTNEEEMKIYSVVMRPNIDIFRKNINGEPATVFYTKETVEKQQVNYFRNNGNAATNINHSHLADAEGIFPFESWIVKDAKTDRATMHFGMDVQDGDWVMGYKVDNVELWNEHIKEGKLDGLSIEATNINYVEMNTDKKSKKDAVVAFFKEGLNTLLGDAEKFEGEIAEVSKWWQTVVNDTFEMGEVVMRKAPDGEGEDYPADAGEFELEDGSRILTDKEGIIRFKFPAPAAAGDDAGDAAGDDEQMAAEDETEEEKAARIAEEEAAAAADDAGDDAAGDDAGDELSADEIKALQDENADLKAQVADLKAEKVKAETDLETMTADKKKVDKKLVEMGKQTPAASRIKNLPKVDTLEMTAENYDKMTNAQKVKFNRENKKY